MGVLGSAIRRGRTRIRLVAQLQRSITPADGFQDRALSAHDLHLRHLDREPRGVVGLGNCCIRPEWGGHSMSKRLLLTKANSHRFRRRTPGPAFAGHPGLAGVEPLTPGAGRPTSSWNSLAATARASSVVGSYSPSRSTTRRGPCAPNTDPPCVRGRSRARALIDGPARDLH